MIHDGLWCPFENWHMGEAAEHIAAQVRHRPRADRTASPCRAISVPRRPGRRRFAAEVLPVTVGSGREGEDRSPQDEGIRPDTNAEALAKLKPAFGTAAR